MNDMDQKTVMAMAHKTASEATEAAGEAIAFTKKLWAENQELRDDIARLLELSRNDKENAEELIAAQQRTIETGKQLIADIMEINRLFRGILHAALAWIGGSGEQDWIAHATAALEAAQWMDRASFGA